MVRRHLTRSPEEAAAATPATVRIQEKTVQQSGHDAVSMGAPRIARTTTWTAGIYISHA
jgi:hypothetical protein